MVLLDQDGHLLRILNEASGLRHNIVSSTYVDRQGGLWLDLNDGLARVDVTASLSYFDKTTGLSLIDGAAGEIPEAVKTNLSMIVGSGRRLGQLVGDILDYSRLTHGSLKFRRRPVDLRSLAEGFDLHQLLLHLPILHERPSS